MSHDRIIHRFVCFAAMVFCLTGGAQATDYYWDTNGATPDFGFTTLTWGVDANWTTDVSGNFAGGGIVALTSSDAAIFHRNDANGLLTVNVSGSVHANNVLQFANGSARATTWNPVAGGPADAIHVYSTSSVNGLAAIDGNAGDSTLNINVPIVLAQPAGEDAYIGVGGGNNGHMTITGGITSTNSVNLHFGTQGNTTISGSLDIKGTITAEQQGSTTQGRSVTISAVIGSDVTDVTQNSGVNRRLNLNAANLHTGITKSINGAVNGSQRSVLSLGHVDAVQFSTLDVSGAGLIIFSVAGTNTYNLGGLQGQGSISASANGIDPGLNTLKTAGVSPGNSVGLLTVNNPLDISGIVDSGTLLFELGADTTGGTTYDQVVVNDSLNLGILNFADFTFVQEVGFGPGVYTLFEASSIFGSIGTANGTIGGFDALLQVIGNDVVLTTTTASSAAVPEPGSIAIWAIIGLGLAGFGCLRHRRQE